VVQQRDGALYLDLPGAVRAQLGAAGVSQIEMADLCTACHTEEWFSHRAEQGRTGRFGALVMLATTPPTTPPTTSSSQK
jgi:copper oxidase (laccase) domain-containing protein